MAAAKDYCAARHEDLALLAVWPPDDASFSQWCPVWRGGIIMACDDWDRFDAGQTGDPNWRKGWQMIETVTVPPGEKGGSELRTFQR